MRPAELHPATPTDLRLRDLPHALLHGARGHQPVHAHLPRLADAVAAVLCLRIVVRVVVGVVQDHLAEFLALTDKADHDQRLLLRASAMAQDYRVRSREVDASAARLQLSREGWG